MCNEGGLRGYQLGLHQKHDLEKKTMVMVEFILRRKDYKTRLITMGLITEWGTPPPFSGTHRLLPDP